MTRDELLETLKEETDSDCHCEGCVLLRAAVAQIEADGKRIVELEKALASAQSRIDHYRSVAYPGGGYESR